MLAALDVLRQLPGDCQDLHRGFVGWDLVSVWGCAVSETFGAVPETDVAFVGAVLSGLPLGEGAGGGIRFGMVRNSGDRAPGPEGVGEGGGDDGGWRNAA